MSKAIIFFADGLEECEALIKAASAQAEAISDFGDIRVLNGRYGPYIKKGGDNYRIPKGRDAASLTKEDCEQIIASAPAARKKK